jgi:dCTP diphosphatase
MTGDLEDIGARLRRFAQERDWEQFHTPKNLSLALMGEVGELAAELQWLTEEQIHRKLNDSHLRDRLADEMADVLIYLIRLADVTDVDLISAVRVKIDKNEHRYPPDLAHGRAVKYTQLRTSDATHQEQEGHEE